MEGFVSIQSASSGLSTGCTSTDVRLSPGQANKPRHSLHLCLTAQPCSPIIQQMAVDSSHESGNVLTQSVGLGDWQP